MSAPWWLRRYRSTSAGRKVERQHKKTRSFAGPLDVVMYAQHGHELMGCKFSVGGPKLIRHGSIITTSWRQGQTREGTSERSPSV